MELVYCKIGKRIKRISLQRYLTTKIVRELDKVTNYDLFALFENQLWLERKCLTDNDFCSKFGGSLGEISQFLKEVNLRKDFSPKSLTRLRSRLETLESFLVPTRNYQSFKSRFAGSFHILPALQPGIPKSKLPPKRFIGKGYGDKGTLKNEAVDGSPSWQTLSSVRWTPTLQEAEDAIRNAKTYEEIEGIFAFCFFPEGPLPSNWRDLLTRTKVDPERIRKAEEAQEVRNKYHF